jgi:hypothetical protein
VSYFRVRVLLIHSGLCMVCFLDPEDEGDIFRNVGCISTR